ncbi:MAG: carboxypeptidase regulatory-like domain-containing protein [Planctomycetaceae bacterium]|nr:carboxypeptidase regulatory-like domain-containing protein [Planctomycetaceae bacterium]
MGCGNSDPLNRQAVSGKITLDGQPLNNGTIEFTPVENGNPSGASIQNGEFSIPSEKGLPPGDYIVRISASDPNEKPVEAPGESHEIAPELIPEEYNVKSALRFHVDANMENVFDLNVEKAGSPAS